MSESSDTPFLPFIPLPYIEAQFANPRLPIYLKCMLYKQIRIDVAPHIMDDKHWIAPIKALIKDHYLNWQRHHSDHLALNGYILFTSNGRSVRFPVLAPLNTIEAEHDTEEPRITVAAINDDYPANPWFSEPVAIVLE